MFDTVKPQGAAWMLIRENNNGYNAFWVPGQRFKSVTEATNVSLQNLIACKVEI